MKMLLLLLLLALMLPIASASASDSPLPSVSIQTSVLDTSFIRRLRDEVTDSDACQEDMAPLEFDYDLAQSLQHSIDKFNKDFERNLRRHCAFTGTGIRTIDGYRPAFTSCIINYEDYTTGYQNTCKDSNAMYYPVSFLMQCSDDETTDVEMEIMNIPSCVGHSCDVDAVNTAIARILDSADVTVLLSSSSRSRTSENDRIFTSDKRISTHWGHTPLSCRIFHNIGIKDPANGSKASTRTVLSLGASAIVTGMTFLFLLNS